MEVIEVKNIIFLFIRSQMAEAVPPLGTVLGNIGINATKFCKDFNEYTKDLPSFFLLKVKILVMEDRSYNFFIFLPSTGSFLSILKFQKSIRSPFGKIFIENRISLKEVVCLAKFKFPYISLPIAINIVMGSVKSSNLLIDF